MIILRRDEGFRFTDPSSENPDKPDAHVYSNINEVETNKADYQNNGQYQFRLTYDHVDGSTDILAWRQSSFPTDSGSIRGYETIYIIVPTETAGECKIFEGLGLSPDTCGLLDGNGDGSCWWDAVGNKHIW